MRISIVNIVRNSLRFSLAKFFSALISIPVTLYVAVILVPAEYGTYGFLGLWLTYAGLIGPGIFLAGRREIPVLLGNDNEQEALRIQNISITADSLSLIIPFAVILGASLFFSEPVLRIGLIMIGVSYLVSNFVRYWEGINVFRQRFSIAAKGTLVRGITAPLAIAASVYWLKVYALLLAPIAAAVVSGIYYWKKGPINYRFIFDRKETTRLIKVGVILKAMILVFYVFRLADRTIIASTLTLGELGLYTFAMGFMMYAVVLFADFSSVLQPVLWREAGKADNIFEGFRDTKRIAVYIALGAAVIIPIAQLGFYLAVSLIATKYVGAISIFHVLSYNLYLASIVMIPDLILTSKIVNKQKISLYVYSVGLALNIIFDLLVIKLGYGVVGVAWVTICTQGLVTVTLYYLVKSYMFRNTMDYLRFQIAILVPFLATIPFYFLHNYLNLATTSFWAFASISLVAQFILWSLVIGVFYRGYLSINDIKMVMKEINIAIRGRLSR